MLRRWRVGRRRTARTRDIYTIYVHTCSTNSYCLQSQYRDRRKPRCSKVTAFSVFILRVYIRLYVQFISVFGRVNTRCVARRASGGRGRSTVGVARLAPRAIFSFRVMRTKVRSRDSRAREMVCQTEHLSQTRTRHTRWRRRRSDHGARSELSDRCRATIVSRHTVRFCI